MLVVPQQIHADDAVDIANQSELATLGGTEPVLFLPPHPRKAAHQTEIILSSLKYLERSIDETV